MSSIISILGIAVALGQCLTEDFIKYSKQIVANSRTLANKLIDLGYTLVSGYFYYFIKNSVKGVEKNVQVDGVAVQKFPGRYLLLFIGLFYEESG